MLLIGSTALHLVAPELKDRQPADLDMVMSYDELKAFMALRKWPCAIPTEGGSHFVLRGIPDVPIHDIEIAWKGSLAEQLLELVKEDPRTTTTGMASELPPRILVPSLDVLYMLKMTHRFKKNSPHFSKTREDIWAMEQAGAKIPEAYQAWYAARTKETLNHKHPNLNQSKDGFFNGDGVVYTYDHDSIHEAVKLGVRPAYTYFQKEGAAVACSREKFESLPYDVQLNSVVEEAMVLAIERALVPFPQGMKSDPAFKMALEKVCTSISSGWWREFAWRNYDAAQMRYVLQGGGRFWEDFKHAVSAGLVKPYSGQQYTA